jgi:hypothetical protein
MLRLFEDAVNSVDEVAQQEPEHVDTIEIVCEFTMNRFHFLSTNSPTFHGLWFQPSEKYSSDWIIIPTIGENNKNVSNHQSDLMVYHHFPSFSPCFHRTSWYPLR